MASPSCAPNTSTVPATRGPPRPIGSRPSGCARQAALAAALENAERGLALAREDDDAVALALLAGRLHLDLGAARQARPHFETALARAADDVGRGEAELGIAEIVAHHRRPPRRDRGA